MGIDPLECHGRDAYEAMCEIRLTLLECGHTIAYDGTENIHDHRHWCVLCKKWVQTDAARRDYEERFWMENPKDMI